MSKLVAAFLGMLYIVLCIVPAFGNNIVMNPGFEDWVNPVPENWSSHVWDPGEGYSDFYMDTEHPYSGGKCLVIQNVRPNDARVVQIIPTTGNKIYELSCRVKTENVGTDAIGAHITIQELNEVEWDLRGTNTEWQKMVVYLRTGETISEFHLCLALGGFGGTNTGKAFFDDVQIKEVTQIPDPAAAVINLGGGVVKISKAHITSHTGFEVSIMLGFLLFNTVLALLYSIARKKGKPVIATIFNFRKKSP